MKPHPSPLVRTHKLGAGWKLVPGNPLPDGRDLGPDDEPGFCLEWTVEGPHSGESASVHFALDHGHCSDPSETRIPGLVHRNLGALSDDLGLAGVLG